MTNTDFMIEDAEEMRLMRGGKPDKPRHNYWLFIAIVAAIVIGALASCSPKLTDYQQHPPRYNHGNCKVCGKVTCEGVHPKNSKR